ncbi:MAG: hypothetical protein B6U97_04635 [Candidatus Altiarchaeales archaeon ex4484_96]|nr:MAG: hypothetical protein B6U97_04635 [Candidatus Altiarchaeales archaeon ex4484_96]
MGTSPPLDLFFFFPRKPRKPFFFLLSLGLAAEGFSMVGFSSGGFSSGMGSSIGGSSLGVGFSSGGFSSGMGSSAGGFSLGGFSSSGGSSNLERLAITFEYLSINVVFSAETPSSSFSFLAKSLSILVFCLCRFILWDSTSLKPPMSFTDSFFKAVS